MIQRRVRLSQKTTASAPSFWPPKPWCLKERFQIRPTSSAGPCPSGHGPTAGSSGCPGSGCPGSGCPGSGRPDAARFAADRGSSSSSRLAAGHPGSASADLTLLGLLVYDLLSCQMGLGSVRDASASYAGG